MGRTTEYDETDYAAEVIFTGINVEDFFRFERQVLRWCKKKYGDYGAKLWLNTTVTIDANTVDSVAQDTWESILEKRGTKEASENWEWDYFWTIDHQEKWRAKAISAIKDYVESKTSDKAFIFITEQDESDWANIRELLQKEYGQATKAKIKVLEMEYELGMPANKGCEPFPSGIDMEDKLYQLGQRRTRLWFLAPENIRATYHYGKQSTLVRIILNHLTDNTYLTSLNSMMMMHKFRLEQSGANIPEDTRIENYSDEWLPPYKSIKENLLATFETLQLGKAQRSNKGLPALATTETQSRKGKGTFPCWGCGQPGHRRGDPLCRAGPNDIHSSAPAHIQDMHQKGILRPPRAPGSSNAPKDPTKELCRNHQKGYCRFGGKCKRSHDGRGSGGGGGGGGKHPSAKQFSTMVMQSMASSIKNAQKKKSRKRDDSDSESDSDAGDSNDQGNLLALLTTATRGKKKKKGRIGMMAMTIPKSFKKMTQGDGGSVRALAELHSSGVCGVDTCASRFVTTNPQCMIKSMMNTSEAMINSLSFNSAAGETKVLGVGPAVKFTCQTANGETVAVLDPQGVLLEKPHGGNEITVHSAQRLKAMGLSLQQNYNGSDDDVLVCRRSGQVIKLHEENGILVLKCTKRHAAALEKIVNLELLIDDIANKRASCIVPLSLKTYHGAALLTKSCRTLPSQLQAAKGNLGESTSADTIGVDSCAYHHVGRTVPPPNLAQQMPTSADTKRKVDEDDSAKDFSQGGVGATRSAAAKRVRIAQPTPAMYKAGKVLLLTNTKKKFVVLAFNEAKLTVEQRSRLWHYRLIHKSPTVPVNMYKKDLADGIECTHTLNEPCAICDGSKFRTKPFPRNDLAIKQKLEVWEKAIFDGYGGQGSMGCESYDGAVGGYIFVDARSNAWKKYLYSSEGQLPAILKRFITWLELNHRKLRILVCDPKSVNISEAIEEICDEHDILLRPCSTNTPEEIGGAEKAVGDLRRDSRAALQAAPHLPNSMWGCADEYAAYVHYCCGSASNEGGLTPYEVCEGRKPDLKQMCIHVFGCPVAMKPPSKKHKDKLYDQHLTQNKNKPVAIYGHFVGIIWPRVLVLRSADKKIVAVSRKKVIWYEAIYCLPPNENPVTKHLVSIEPLTADKDAQYHPKHVQSIKTVAKERGLIAEDKFGGKSNALEGTWQPNPDHFDQGEILENIREDNIEIETAHGQNLIAGVQQELQKTRVEPALRKILIAATKKFVQDKDTTVIKKHELRAQRKEARRSQRKADKLALLGARPSDKPVESANLPSDRAYADGEVDTDEFMEEALDEAGQKPLYQRPIGTRVSIESKRFDGDKPGSYSAKKPKHIFGTLKKKGKSGIMYVKWDDDEGLTKSHWKHLGIVGGKMCKKPMDEIVAMVMQDATLAFKSASARGPLPKHFFQAMVSDKWRLWIEAMRKEQTSWVENNAFEVVPFSSVPKDAMVIPLGEIFTEKRDGTAKYRQIAYGQYLRNGIDFTYTFSTTIESETLRWFHSLACACRKVIYGCDAITGYLQSAQRTELYAIKPSHADYLDMTMEELAVLRTKLLDLVKRDGIGALRKLIKEQKASEEYKEVWKLLSAIYGVPDAGHAFTMFVQGILVNDLGITQSEVAPTVYFKYEYYAVGELGPEHTSSTTVKNWIIICIWTDDFRYFGSDGYIQWFEATAPTKMKLKLLGVCDDFVAIDVVQDVDEGTMELKMPKYWVSAVDRFIEYFPQGLREREIPWSEHVKIEKPTVEEIKEARKLPYRELLGVMGFAVHQTKIEVKMYLGLLQQHMQGWSAKLFKLATQLLEYCYTTRELGVIFTADLDPAGVNMLYAYADASFETPRSRGCRIVMMNGGPLAYHSGRHTTNDDSTMKSEITECYHASTEVMFLRNLMAEIGLYQEEPTLIYQDNTAAISVAENRGKLSKAAKALDIRVYGLRNRIEDQAVMLKWLDSLSMLADLGTKLFGVKRFKFLRDMITGYALARAGGKKNLPSLCMSLEQLQSL